MRINKHSFFIISLAVSLGLALQPASAASSALAEAEQHFYRARRLLDTDLSGALQALRQAKQALQRSSSESSHRVIQMASREIPKQQMAELFLERSVQPAGRALLHSQIPPLQHKIEGRMEHTRRLLDWVRDHRKQNRLQSALLVLESVPEYAWASQPQLRQIRQEVEAQSRQADQFLTAARLHYAQGAIKKARQSLKKAYQLNREKSFPALTAALEESGGVGLGKVFRKIADTALTVAVVAVTQGVGY